MLKEYLTGRKECTLLNLMKTLICPTSQYCVTCEEEVEVEAEAVEAALVQAIIMVELVMAIVTGIDAARLQEAVHQVGSLLAYFAASFVVFSMLSCARMVHMMAVAKRTAGGHTIRIQLKEMSWVVQET